MKYIYILLITTTVFAQPDVNVLSEVEFESIQLNGHSLSQIKDTYGEESQIVNLFGVPDEKQISTVSGESYSYFYNQGFEIGFSTLYGGNATLGGFEITDSSMTISINSMNFSVGDNISVLSPLNLVENSGGNYPQGIKAYIIAPCEKCNHFIYIKYSVINQKIIEVGYLELT
ncbi:hypothetical protein [Psychroflexus sp. MES1-P1E]|uniref:hypothetical protein n=1 Tax=Psychroflexus sp. MES1-P1E TaxID=2058320 RepID=UPI0011AEACD3|nr:hypothetical protein [Psychroflexus sp. MES1-P1E]